MPSNSRHTACHISNRFASFQSTSAVTRAQAAKSVLASALIALPPGADKALQILYTAAEAALGPAPAEEYPTQPCDLNDTSVAGPAVYAAPAVAASVQQIGKVSALVHASARAADSALVADSAPAAAAGSIPEHRSKPISASVWRGPPKTLKQVCCQGQHLGAASHVPPLREPAAAGGSH